MKRIAIMTLAALLCSAGLHAQRYPERKYVRSGNKEYERSNYVESETAYRHALEKTPGSYEAQFNLGNALYKQGRYPDAAQLYGQLAADSTQLDRAAGAFYNTGNALFQQRQLEQALEAYKNALRLNPGDEQAKFNLAYTKKLLNKDKQNQSGGNDQNKNNQDKQNQQNQNDKNQQNQNNQNDKQDQNKQNKNDPDQQQGQQNPDQNKQNSDKSDQSGAEPRQDGMSREEADQMLQAMQNEEDKTREKVNAQKAKAVGRSSKNW